MTAKPKNSHGLSLFATDKRARDASARSRLAAWLAAASVVLSAAALAVALGVPMPALPGGEGGTGSVPAMDRGE